MVNVGNLQSLGHRTPVSAGPKTSNFGSKAREMRAHYLITGFIPKYPTFHRVYNLVICVFLLLVLAPTLLIISLALFVTQGREIFYRGPRVGQNGKAFNIIKFRTLDSEKAKQLTKDKVLPVGSGVETPLGKFLRDTRLDELPQIVNILRGDMNICGPRPVRPEMAMLLRCDIPNYDMRFKAKPGLLGPTQAYMGHGTSKKLRARYNYVLCRAPVSYLAEIAVTLRVGAFVVWRSGVEIGRMVERLIRPEGFEARQSVRRAQATSLTYIDAEGFAHKVTSANKTSLQFEARETIPDAMSGKLIITLRGDGKKRVARVGLHRINGTDSYTYDAETEYGQHVISRYLWEDVVVPHRPAIWPSLNLGQLFKAGNDKYKIEDDDYIKAMPPGE